MPTLLYETQNGRNEGRIIAGVDEAGRGPLAGPVMAAAVILPRVIPAELMNGINDSKALSAKKRDALFPLIKAHCTFAIAEASVAEIDTLNILHASLLAMTRALAALEQACDVALIDGNKKPKMPPGIRCTAITLVKGDALSLSIAAASILAKVARDARMQELHAAHPHYGWDKNAGYPTESHRAALAQHGITPHHRTSFGPVKKIYNKGGCGSA